MTKFYLPTTKVAVFVALFSLLIGGFAFGDEDFYLKEANMKVRGLSGFVPLETVQTHSLLFEASECYEGENGCFSDIQNFTQNWYDLDLFFVDNKGNVGHHTIMDRNMGATEVYNKKFGLGNINTGSFGYRYQWGNNYGFKPCYTNGCSDFLEETYTPGIPYHVRDYVYNEGLDWNNPIHFFSQNVWSDGYSVFDSEVESQTAETIKPPQSIRDKQWKNLRGGVGDTCDDEGNCSEGDGRIVYHYNTTEYTIENGNSVPHATEATKTREKTRQGPCPDEYHVPSAKEWDEILLGWAYGKNKQVSSTYSHYFGGNNAGKELSSDLLLPPAGFRKAIESIYSGDRQGDIGTYRSSTPIEQNQNGGLYHGNSSAKRFEFDSDYIHNGATISHSSSVTQEGVPVRCLKNTADSELNVYPNGGTNAFISIYKGKIIALGTPKRAGYTFEGWYRNEDFTGKKVEVGDNVDNRGEQVGIGQTSIPHLDLYAKRKANPRCTDLPANATANNYNTPTSDTKYYYSTNKSLTCTFQCNSNYTWNSTTSKCVPNGCQGTLPANATLWNPSIVPSNNTTSYSYSATSTTEACKFKCNTNYTWNSSTSSCKAVPQSHTLTINYFFSNGSIASNSVTKQLFSGDSYNITSPIISNYTADIGIVSGIMPDLDKTITVTYTKNTNSGVGGGSSSSYNSSNYYLDVYAYPSSPDTYDWIKLTIETDDDYTGKISFSKFQYRSSSSSSWSNISRTSSVYVSDYSDEWSDGYYKMTSSDDGEAVLKNLVKFKKSGYYRIYIKDTDGNEDYVQINVDASSSSSSSNDNLEAYVSPSSPDVYDWIKLTIETDDNYAGKINFSKFQYRSSSSSSWSNISRTSSVYVSDYSDEWSDGYHKMTSSDDGEAVLKNFVKFKKSGYYRIYIEDADDNETYVQINVGDDSGNNSESNSNSDLSLSASDSYPYTNKPISLTIKTEGDYSGKIKLYAKYRDSSGSRTKITNTSSTYFSDYSNIWENGYYNMKSSDKGKKTLNDLIEFKKEGAYRIYAEDEQGYSNYISVNVASSSNAKSSNDSANQVKTSNTDTGDDIDKLISQLLGNDSGVSSDINNDIERNKNNLKGVSDEIYKSRSCKEYRIQYNVDLGVFTSPDLKKKEFFINKEYLKRYIDSKNPQKDGCPVNSGWITTIYRDKSSNNGHYISPNGKIYFISFENGYYFSDDLTVQKKFSTISEIKYYIRDRNPLIGMQ